jgi:hypothetical protein
MLRRKKPCRPGHKHLCSPNLGWSPGTDFVRCRDDTGEIRAVRDAPREREPLEPRSTADPILMVDGRR